LQLGPKLVQANVFPVRRGLLQFAEQFRGKGRRRRVAGNPAADTADLEFHLLELPKFGKSAAELESGLDIWLYFLRHAANIDLDALPAALDRPLVRRALEELKMLSQTDLERERYEARRKAQLDYNTGMKVARMEGREEGLLEGEQIGRIHAFERLLQRPETPTEQLAALSVEELTRRADELQALLQKKPG
jgi:predicted transposase/invertase (TIGR01784 family)